jgi:hypothetical protein
VAGAGGVQGLAVWPGAGVWFGVGHGAEGGFWGGAVWAQLAAERRSVAISARVMG